MYVSRKGYNRAVKQQVKGKWYDSKFEGGQALILEAQKQKGEIKDFETHVPIDLIVNGYLIETYKIDFKIYHNDGTIEFLETKGMAFPAWKKTWKLFEALFGDFPNTKLTVVYQGKSWKPHRRKIK